ncbi:16S rRNA processing protein RimM [Hydrogenispora ethanolica]|jgi:16S rRNA processing protein RimM|uniref:Ribosome maturation factor RimM n=1 Tax=Hydrogenispora ethanolica TaxID=1082276 RepID=A0A4R1QL62_HYDET|nr:ribosome maturation factor RimM [Hydrogenispora ethanolica]TCL53917.1 16S rRNA processing protein RimM [Hydrogenispora ethanolica]
METPDLIAIGEIIKAQGIKGELKVIPLTENPRRFGEVKRVFFHTQSGWQELFIEKYRDLNGIILLKFAGIDDLTAANLLGRGLIYIPRSERPPLPQGRYYFDEIEGLRVFTTSGRLLGVIDQILETGSNHVYRIQGDGKPILLPALKSVIQSIDLTEGKMTVELPEGLLEEDI